MTGKKIDVQWFRERFREKDISQNQMAKMLGIGHSALSLTLSGQRKMTMAEASMLSTFFGKDLSEIAEKAGIETHGNTDVPLVGALNGALELVASPKGATSKTVTMPSRYTSKALIALRVEDTESPMFGWTVYYESRSDVKPDVIGRLCVVKLATKECAVRFVKRGLDDNVYTVFWGSNVKHAALEIASPVIWIKP